MKGYWKWLCFSRMNVILQSRYAVVHRQEWTLQSSGGYADINVLEFQNSTNQPVILFAFIFALSHRDLQSCTSLTLLIYLNLLFISRIFFKYMADFYTVPTKNHVTKVCCFLTSSTHSSTLPYSLWILISPRPWNVWFRNTVLSNATARLRHFKFLRQSELICQQQLLL